MSVIAHRTPVQMLVTGKKMLMGEIGGNYLFLILTCLSFCLVEENSTGLDLWPAKFDGQSKGKTEKVESWGQFSV